ncbi:divalent cation tolerance protein CutA [Streptomyces sp. SID4920]|nr:divalent cation tolerance protein CutA [Streptomyces sp. SID4920]MYX67408.1 divalent cation tolerance protein CutA [Streptomyces sp. SID8373]
MKTTADRYGELEAYLLDQHPWDNPEICAVPVTQGADRCLLWIEDSVKRA